MKTVRASGFNMTTTTLSILGKSFACMAFAVVYVYASELFPTEARNVVLGTAKTCSRISSMAASYVGGPLVSYSQSPSRIYPPLYQVCNQRRCFGCWGQVTTLTQIPSLDLRATLRRRKRGERGRKEGRKGRRATEGIGEKYSPK